MDVNATKAVTVVAAQVPREKSAGMRSKMRRGAKEVPLLGRRMFAVSGQSSG